MDVLDLLIDTRYVDWIDRHYPTRDSAFIKCYEATTSMVEEFPELKRVRGYYHDTFDGKRPHWWCVDESGVVVDPTYRQFTDGGHFGEYEPYDEGLGEPKGKCMNCGEISYLYENACSDSCVNELEFMLNNDV